MSILMRSFIVRTEYHMDEILKEYVVKYEKSGFELKKKYMKFPPEYCQTNMDFVCCSTFINPLKIQCRSCFSIVRKKMISCDLVFVHVKNESGVKMSSLIHNLSVNDRIVVFNGFFTYVFGVQHLIIRPCDINLRVFHFKFNIFPLFKNTVDLNSKNRFKLSDKEVYSLFGRVTEIKNNTDKDIMHLKIQCYGYQKSPVYIYEHEKFSHEEIMSMVKCNCFSEFIDVMVKDPSIHFISLVIHQQILINNLRVKFPNSANLMIVNGKSKNIKTVSKNTILTPSKTKLVSNKLNLDTLPELDKNQMSNTTSLAHGQDSPPNKLEPEPNQQENITSQLNGNCFPETAHELVQNQKRNNILALQEENQNNKRIK